MERIYRLGDRVRVVITDMGDPDYRYHGRTGTVTAVVADSLSMLTGDPRDDYRYCVVFDSEDGLGMWFRHEDMNRIPDGKNASE